MAGGAGWEVVGFKRWDIPYIILEKKQIEEKPVNWGEENGLKRDCPIPEVFEPQSQEFSALERNRCVFSELDFEG